MGWGGGGGGGGVMSEQIVRVKKPSKKSVTESCGLFLHVF